MSTIKIKDKDKNKWEILYADEINYYNRISNNLSDIENKAEARENLGLSDDVTTHNHDSRYNPMVDQEAIRRAAGDNANREKLNSVKNAMDEVLTPAEKTQIVNSVNKLNSDTDTEISIRASSDNTLMKNFKNSIDATQKILDDAQVNTVVTNGTNFSAGNGEVIESVVLSKYTDNKSDITVTRDFSIKPGVLSGEHKLDTLLTRLAKISHCHKNDVSTASSSNNCNCDCNNPRY